MKNNINKFLKLFNELQENIKALANIYYEDLQRNDKAESLYTEKTPLTRTMLRRLVAIAKEDLLPDAFFIGNATAYRMLTTMSKEQQEKALHEKIEIVSEDGSHWKKKFEDLAPRQMNMVYDQRANTFRSEEGQKEWIKANPINKISNAGTLIIEEPKDIKPKKTTKASLIKQLKAMNIQPEDLLKLADVSKLMEAVQLSLKVN
jgi:hypothetical protein